MESYGKSLITDVQHETDVWKVPVQRGSKTHSQVIPPAKPQVFCH
jgi:hypothetical protein